MALNSVLWHILIFGTFVSVLIVAVTIWCMNRVTALLPVRQQPPAREAAGAPAVAPTRGELTRRLLEPRHLLESNAADAATDVRRFAERVAADSARLAAGGDPDGLGTVEVRRLLDAVGELLRMTERAETLAAMVGAVYQQSARRNGERERL
ncbi:hypothetical protein DEH69_13875 [Streptomyces sp. PT12]|nr:hypothetical protein DEH69_13875 [Streptomyces sp. PT12]